MERMNCHTES